VINTTIEICQSLHKFKCTFRQLTRIQNIQLQAYKEVKEWEELEDCLSSVHLIDQEDAVQWALTKKMDSSQ
jgi:hypothetical protein